MSGLGETSKLRSSVKHADEAVRQLVDRALRAYRGILAEPEATLLRETLTKELGDALAELHGSVYNGS